jgi:hypothetical protein
VKSPLRWHEPWSFSSRYKAQATTPELSSKMKASGFSSAILASIRTERELSATVILHRAFLRAGVEAQLVLFWIFRG